MFDPRNAGPALKGVRILDLTTVIFGPYATQTLADYGADVIKVEAPCGDSTRMTGATVEADMAPLFLGSNRNKRSVVLDLKTVEGRAALLALIDTADVFIHNVRPQKLDGLGISADVLRARNPRLIYVGLLGFGSDGPYAGRPAYDDVIQALSGGVELSERHSGTVRYMPTVLADKTGAQMAAHAVLAALFQRERTGMGQEIEVPMFECTVQFLLTEHFFARHQAPTNGGERGADPVTSGTQDEMGYPRTLDPARKPYPTADGYVCLMPYGDRHWHDFFTAIDRVDIAADPRFVTIEARTKNIGTLLALLERETIKRSTDHWLALGDSLGIPCAPVNGLKDLECDPHLIAVKLFGTLDTGSDWTFRYVRSPIAMSGSEVAPTMPPRLGEHTEEVLAEIGLTPEDVTAGTSAAGATNRVHKTRSAGKAIGNATEGVL